MRRCWGGIGTWALTQKHINNSKIKVLDGNYIKEELMLVKSDEFVYVDLAEEKSLQHINEKFDLVISLEVAEHLPATRANSFVNELCGLGDVILFSAAIPGQGGEGHINEQFLSYWKSLFEKNNYTLHDIIRVKLQDDDKVCPWYRQNMVVFSKKDTEINEKLTKINNGKETIVDVIIPEFYLSKIDAINQYEDSKLGKILKWMYKIVEWKK